jgi:glycosyltransferase involved in cell wall biosynthesis
VVASRLNGIPEAIVPGQNGTLLDPLDSDAFVTTILDLLEDDKRREELGEKACDFVRNRYSWDIIARRYLQVFMKVIQARYPSRVSELYQRDADPKPETADSTEGGRD